MLKKLGIPVFALAAAMTLFTPSAAQAGVRFGFGMAVPAYAYRYTYRHVIPYYAPYYGYGPYAYSPYAYGYPVPYFGYYRGWGYGGYSGYRGSGARGGLWRRISWRRRALARRPQCFPEMLEMPVTPARFARRTKDLSKVTNCAPGGRLLKCMASANSTPCAVSARAARIEGTSSA